MTTTNDLMPAGLTILGNRAGSPGPDGPASCYLIESEYGRVVIDLGGGSLTQLLPHLSAELDGIIVSHRHADHSVDLVPFAYHRSFPFVQPPIALYGPTGISEYIAELDAVHGIPTIDSMRTPLRSQFPPHDVTPGNSFVVAKIEVDTVRAAHAVPCLSMRFPQLGLVYTADTAITDDLIDLASGAPVLLAEATYASSVDRDLTTHGHMSGTEAGILASEAGVEHLILTHLSDYADSAETLANARAKFSGRISIARVGEQHALPGRIR